MGHIILGTVAGYIIGFIALVMGAGWVMSFGILIVCGSVVAIGSAIWSVKFSNARKTPQDDCPYICPPDDRSAKNI